MVPFEPDGVFAGIPYRALPDGTIEAMMPGGLVKFKDVDQIVAVANGTPAFSIVTTQAIVPHDQVVRSEGNGGLKVQDYQSLLLEAVKNNSHNSSGRLPVVQQQEQFRRDDQSGYSSMSLIDLMRHIHEMALVVARIEAERIRDQSERACSQQIGSSASPRSFPASATDSQIPARLAAQPSSASETPSQSDREGRNDQTHPPEETDYQTYRGKPVEQSQTNNQLYTEPTDDKFIDDRSDHEQSESVDMTSSPSRELQILAPASTSPSYQSPPLTLSSRRISGRSATRRSRPVCPRSKSVLWFVDIRNIVRWDGIYCRDTMAFLEANLFTRELEYFKSKCRIEAQ